MRSHSSLSLSTERLNQLREIAAGRGLTIAALLDGLIVTELRRLGYKDDLCGFLLDERFRQKEGGGRVRVVRFSHSEIGSIDLEPDEARAFARGVLLMQKKRRDYTGVLDQSGQLTLNVQKSGRAYSISIIRGRGEKQIRKTQDVPLRLLARVAAQLMAAADRADTMKSRAVPETPGAGEWGAFEPDMPSAEALHIDWPDKADLASDLDLSEEPILASDLELVEKASRLLRKDLHLVIRKLVATQSRQAQK